MFFFSNLRIAQRLLIGFAIAIAALLLIAYATIQSMNTLKEKMNSIVLVNEQESSLAAQMLDQAQQLRIEYRQALLDFTFINSQAEQSAAIARVTQAREQVLKTEEALRALFDKYSSEMVPRERELLAKLATDRSNAMNEVDTLLVLLRSGDNAKSFAQLTNRTSPAMATFAQTARDITKEESDLNTLESNNFLANMEKLREQLLISVLIAGVLLVAASWLISRSILNSLGGDPIEVKETVQAVANGDFTVQIHLKPQDRSSLLYSFATMVKKLGSVLGEVNYMSSNLFSASEQMASTATSLSSGAMQQASSVEETSSSVEEMSATVSQNTDNARVADGIASKTAGSATQTGQAVDNMVHAMKEIAGRITVINDIANKTDLLAINAAIEAARAGEHGKGFATVAIEVRKLAERSQVAAREIGELALRSVNIAEKAGDQLNNMLPGINQTATLVQEIAAGSREQAAGIRQINAAMTQISSTMQMAAASSEELSATAEEVSKSASVLQELMQQFILNHSRNHRAAATARKHGPTPAAPAALADEAGDDDEVDMEKFSRF